MSHYIRLSVVSIPEVLPLIKFEGTKARDYIHGESVKVCSLRLRTFAKCGTTCSSCGLEATHFALEKTINDVVYHLNLYGVKDGEEIMFTHDHTLARSLGGKDGLSNTTTMCTTCNFHKSIGEREEVESRRKHAKQNQS